MRICSGILGLVVGSVFLVGCGSQPEASPAGEIPSKSQQVPGLPISLANPLRFKKPDYWPGDRTAALPRRGDRGWTIDFTVHEALKRNADYYLVLKSERMQTRIDVTKQLSADRLGRLSTGDMSEFSGSLTALIEEEGEALGPRGTPRSNVIELGEVYPPSGAK